MNSSSSTSGHITPATVTARHASYPQEMIGHGQHGEDRLLVKIFAGATTGVCVEVGAFDGVVGSATYAFEQLGWDAILVEPQPELAAAIARSRRGRLFAVAAGAVNGKAWIVPHPDDTAQTGVTTRPPGETSTQNSPASPTAVQMRTLDSILKECGVGRVDFATIDVEGAELDVLRGWDLRRWNPRIIILEDNSRGLDDTIPGHLDAQGYVCFARTGVNDWYARRTDRRLARTWPCARRRCWRRWRRLREHLRRLAPPSLKSLLRRAHIAGE